MLVCFRDIDGDRVCLRLQSVVCCFEARQTDHAGNPTGAKCWIVRVFPDLGFRVDEKVARRMIRLLKAHGEPGEGWKQGIHE